MIIIGRFYVRKSVLDPTGSQALVFIYLSNIFISNCQKLSNENYNHNQVTCPQFNWKQQILKNPVITLLFKFRHCVIHYLIGISRREPTKQQRIFIILVLTRFKYII